MAENEPSFLVDPSLERELLDAVDSRRARARSMDRRATPELAERVSQIARTNPTLLPGVNTTAAQAGLSQEHLDRLESEQAHATAGDPGLWGSVGDVVSAAGTQVARGAKGVARGVTTGFETLREELFSIPAKRFSTVPEQIGLLAQGDFEGMREVQGRDFGSSQGRIAAQQLLDEGRIDLGEGFFPGGQVEAVHRASVGEELPVPEQLAELESDPARRQRLAERLQDEFSEAATRDGEPISWGRSLAVQVSEPGTKPYNIISGLVDGATAIFADPAAIATGTGAGVSKAAKSFTPAEDLARSAGLVAGEGRRSTVVSDVAEEWLTKGDGARVVDWLVDTNSFDTIWRSTNKKLPRQVALDLADAADSKGVRQVLMDAITEGGVASKNAFKVPTRFDVKGKLSSVRMLGEMPGTHLGVDDIDEALKTFDDFQQTAKLPRDVRAANNARLARVADGDNQGAWEATRHMLSTVDEHLKAEFGQDMDLAGHLTRAVDKFSEDLRLYNIDRIGSPVNFAGAKSRVLMDGTEETLNTAHLLTEYWNRTIPLPDARELRAAAHNWSVARKVFQSKAWEIPAGVASGYMSNIWKPFQLARYAWPIRVIGEEQVRMGAANLDSMFAHPIRFFAWRTGRKGADDVHGGSLEDAEEFLAAMSQRASGFLDKPKTRGMAAEAWTKVHKADKGFTDAWGRELAQLWNDPVARQVAARPSAEVKEWFWSGEGAKFRDRLVRGSNLEKHVLETRRGADDYIESVWDRIRVKTGGNPELLEAITDGTLAGKNVRGAGTISARTQSKILSRYVDDAPEVVKGEAALFGPAADSLGQQWDAAVDGIFNALMTARTNNLSRAPAFKQFYWQNVEELLPFMDGDTQIAAKRAAHEAGVMSRRRVFDAKKPGPPDARFTSLDDVDMMAKGRALDQTKNLLYDVTKRSQFADVTRIIFPFAEAYKEVATTWMRLVKEDPTVLRRVQQGVEGARSAGVLYPDPSTGEEKFAYPGGGLLSRWLFDGAPGASMRLEGGAANVNIFSQSIGPGFGPVVQWPAAAFMPDDPDWGWVRDLVLPFGGDEISTPGAVLDASLPAFASKLVQSFSKGKVDQRLWNNVTADIARAAVASGERSIDTPDEMQETMEWAAGKASLLYAIRGTLQSTLPTGPDPKLEVKDPDGAWFSLQVLGQDFRDIRDEAADDYQASQIFHEKYGFEPWFIAQAKTRELKERPLSEGGDEWLRRNKDLLEDYDLTVGYIAPDPEGELDFSAYYRTFDEDARAALSDEQQAALARKAKGYMLYNNAMRKADDDGLKGDDLTEWRSLVKASIEEELPGWQNPVLGVPEGASREQKIDEIEAMTADPRLRDNRAVEAARLYTQRRREAFEIARERGYDTLGGQNVEDLRHYLWRAGNQLASDIPEFAGMWREVFSREVED